MRGLWYGWGMTDTPRTEADMTREIEELTEDLAPAEIMGVILTVADAFSIDLIAALEAIIRNEALDQGEQCIADLIDNSQDGGVLEATRRLLQAVRLDQAILEL